MGIEKMEKRMERSMNKEERIEEDIAGIKFEMEGRTGMMENQIEDMVGKMEAQIESKVENMEKQIKERVDKEQEVEEDVAEIKFKMDERKTDLEGADKNSEGLMFGRWFLST